MPKIKAFKKLFLIFILLEIFFSYSPAFAVTTADGYNYSNAGISAQIKQYLCAPSEVPASQTNYTNGALNSQGNFQQQAAYGNANSSDLYDCINRMYRVAIILAGVVGVFFIVIAGYTYMSAEGNDESVSKAKDILVSTISSMVILMAGFILLKALNPDLIQFRSIQPPSIKISDLKQLTEPTAESEGAGGGDVKIIGSTGITGCTNCIDYTANGLTGNSTQKAGKNTFANQSLISKLVQAKSKYSNFIITEAFPPTVTHQSSCHYDGTCIDIAGLNKSTSELDNLCKALKDSGISILNEYPGINTPNCGNGTQTALGTGGHLHIK